MAPPLYRLSGSAGSMIGWVDHGVIRYHFDKQGEAYMIDIEILPLERHGECKLNNRVCPSVHIGLELH